MPCGRGRIILSRAFKFIRHREYIADELASKNGIKGNEGRIFCSGLSSESCTYDYLRFASTNRDEIENVNL